MEYAYLLWNYWIYKPFLKSSGSLLLLFRFLECASSKRSPLHLGHRHTIRLTTVDVDSGRCEGLTAPCADHRDCRSRREGLVTSLRALLPSILGCARLGIPRLLVFDPVPCIVLGIGPHWPVGEEVCHLPWCWTWGFECDEC